MISLGLRSDSYAVPAGSSDVIFTGSVNLMSPTGITQQVFDTLSTALKCTHYMEANKLYSLPLIEDITILNLRSKLSNFRKHLHQSENDEQSCFYLSWKSSSSNS